MSTSERTGVDLIEAAVVDVLGFSLQELRRQRRQREVVEARLVLIYLIRKMHPKATLMELGTYIGRSHATIIHYAIAHRNLCDTDKEYKSAVRKVERRLAELMGQRQVDTLDMFAIYRPNGTLVEESVAGMESLAWYKTSMQSDLPEATLKSTGWQCRPVKVTVTSTKS